MDTVKLTRADWEEISACLAIKEAKVRVGDYRMNPPVGCSAAEKRAHNAEENKLQLQWASDLARIRREIDGKDGDGKRAARLGVQAVRS